ncbi:MAG TPA: GNAT family N-acetyltransferase [Thermomicrobiaceae bacterium]|nr:GNAT family N-acetyltransferase [Thermomicrobiaceae bacterium]
MPCIMATEPSPFTLQRLQHVDGALAQHLNAVFDDKTWDAEQGERFLRDPENLLVVAFCSDQPCGFVSAHRLQRFDRRGAEVLLYEIGVVEAYRRQGVGTALIHEVKRWAREVGADEVWVLTERTNQAAMALYRATGGQEDSPHTTMFTYAV